MFKALLLEKKDDGVSCQLTELDEARLPEGDVLVQPEYSTLNYKDGLAITNRAPVVRLWPMVPGIDGAGRGRREPASRTGRRATASCTTAGASAKRAGAA